MASGIDELAMAERRVLHTSKVEYLTFPEQFRLELCKGFDHVAVAKMLRRRGHLRHEPDRLTIKHRLPGIGKAPVYHILPSIFADEL